MALGAAGILYAALIALVQRDAVRLVAYGSVAQLGFVVVGLFTFNLAGLEGAVVQMLSHGLCTAVLFLAIGMLYRRRQTRELDAFGGIARPMPVFAALFGVAVLSSLGCPP